MAEGKLLEIKNLTINFHTYIGKVQAVRNIDFDLNEGEVLAIVGESGSGKSVSTQAILGLTPIPPGEIESGQILFRGKNLLDYNEKQLADICGSQISMIFQDPMTSLNPTMKIGKQIQEVLHQHATLTRQESRAKAIELMDIVGIPDSKMRLGQYPHEFSGGMLQRVMIAIAIANHPDILIADEPTTALDVTIQSQIFRRLRKLQKDFQMSTILITHNLGVVAGMANRIIVMYAGKIMEEGLTDQIYYHPFHPYTAGLLKAVPSLAYDENKKLRTIEGMPPSLINMPQGCAFADRCGYAMRICKEENPPYFRLEHGNRVLCWLYDAKAEQQLSKFKKREYGK